MIGDDFRRPTGSALQLPLIYLALTAAATYGLPFGPNGGAVIPIYGIMLSMPWCVLLARRLGEYAIPLAAVINAVLIYAVVRVAQRRGSRR